MNGSMLARLTKADEVMFRQFGIDVDLVVEAGIRRLDDAEGHSTLGTTHKGDCAGLWFPFPDPVTGHTVSGCLRRDRPEVDTKGQPSRKYLSAYGNAPHIFFAPGAGAVLADVTGLVVMVESVKAALAVLAACRRAGRPVLVVALGGAHGWHTGRAGKTVDAAGARVNVTGPQPDLARITWTGRDSVIMFDANATTNSYVKSTRRKFADELASRGARVRMATVPEEPGVNGPDDYRAHHDDAALLTLIDDAILVQPATVDELLEDCGFGALGHPAALASVEPALHALRDHLRGADAIRRATARAAAMTRLKAAGVDGPARLVDAALGTPETDPHETPAIVQDVEPWPDPVEGVVVFDLVRALLVGYVVLTPEQATACVLWLAHAFALDAFDHSPILAVLSPVKRCGKSTLLSVLSALADRALHAANATTAVLFRIIEHAKPTLMLDEADTWLHDDQAPLRGIVNSGWARRGAVVLRCEGDENETKTFSTWAPKVIAAIGRLPDTIADRSVIVQLRRKTGSEKTTPLRSRTLDRESQDLRRQLRRWANDSIDRLADASPSIPDELNDRAADSWLPLLAVADLVGSDWPRQARKAALVLSGQPNDDAADESLPVQLLTDIVVLVADADAEVIETTVFLKFLHELPDRPWADYRHGKPMNGHQLARMLAPFGARPRKVRTGPSTTTRGYPVSDLQDALRRYTGSGQGQFRSEQAEQANDSGPKVPISEVEQDADVPLRKSAVSSIDTGSVPLVPLPKGGKGGDGTHPTRNDREGAWLDC